jgi:hypothetical protein
LPVPREEFPTSQPQPDSLHRGRGSADDLIPSLRDFCELLDIFDFEVLDDEIMKVKENGGDLAEKPP